MAEQEIISRLALDEQELYLKIKQDILLKTSISIEDIQSKYSIGYAEAHKMFDLLKDEELLGELKDGRRTIIKDC